MNFNIFKKAIDKQFTKMSASELFVVNVDKDVLWNTYLDSFPEGTNPIFRERREYDCQCCKQFIRACGSVVTVIDNRLVSIWDINIGGHFQTVANALSQYVKSKQVKDIFFSPEKILGTDFNHQLLENGDTIKWEHFCYKLPNKFVLRDAGSTLSEVRSGKEVFKRGLSEITVNAAETVLELIEQNSLYRGTEHKAAVDVFLKHKKIFSQIQEDEKDNYCWITSVEIGAVSRIRNTAIGTLLTDISEDMSLDKAVRLFESKVAPMNYKRPTAVITKSMIANAQKKVQELGIEDSLSRRYAVTEDITINNVLFADRSAKKVIANTSIFDELKSEVSTNIKNLKKVEEVDINTFIENILPKADSIEVMFENKHTNNLMSLIAPQDVNAKDIFKWHNNFSWSYNGEVADSMKQRVKSAGGKVDGVLRFSIQWNDGDNNPNDFDAHCIEPDGNYIYYRNKGRIHPSSGILDVDIVNPGNKVAVENITWSEIGRMQEGEYEFIVHNYAHKGGKTGFNAEIEYNDQIYSYEYNKELRDNQKVLVAKIEFSRETGIKFIESLPSTQASKEIWGVNTNQFHKVSMIMNSPNHWDGRTTGNKHYFFIIGDCKNIETSRGFFNEYLNENLREHRKVFEVLGSKMKVEKSDDQLSGLGFSSTQKNYVFCKVKGSFTRTIKVMF